MGWRERLKRLWCHRTKLLGAIAMAAGYAENNLAQLGHVIPDRYRGALLSGLGVIVFLVGLYNSAMADAAQQ